MVLMGFRVPMQTVAWFSDGIANGFMVFMVIMGFKVPMQTVAWFGDGIALWFYGFYGFYGFNGFQSTHANSSSLNLSDIMIPSNEKTISPIPPPPAFIVETLPTCENISSGMFQFYNHK